MQLIRLSRILSNLILIFWLKMIPYYFYRFLMILYWTSFTCLPFLSKFQYSFLFFSKDISNLLVGFRPISSKFRNSSIMFLLSMLKFTRTWSVFSSLITILIKVSTWDFSLKSNYYLTFLTFNDLVSSPTFLIKFFLYVKSFYVFDVGLVAFFICPLSK